jgi:uncharacterized coiled-coil DUF342 family protein
MERISQHTKSMSQLEDEVGRMKEKVNDIRLEQIQDRERIKSLYDMLNEIKNSLRDIAQKLESGNKKEDLFKETMVKFAVNILQYGVLGGFLYAAIKFGIK